MLRRLAVFILVLMLVAIGVASAQTAGLLRVSAERTNLRDTAAVDGAVVSSLSKGDELEVIEAVGVWYHVRVKTTGKMGYVHSLVVEKVSGDTGAGALPASRPPATTTSPVPPPPPSSAARVLRARQTAPATTSASVVDDRRFGLGLGGGGLAWGLTPSARYWLNEKMGIEVIATFYQHATAISPSVLIRFGEPSTGTVKFLPYFGGGATFFRYDFGPASYSSVGFGGFVGTELVFESVPQLAVSGNVGIYTSPADLRYGAIFTTVGIHWYFK